jgi:hypothetical protein
MMQAGFNSNNNNSVISQSLEAKKDPAKNIRNKLKNFGI